MVNLSVAEDALFMRRRLLQPVRRLVRFVVATCLPEVERIARIERLQRLQEEGRVQIGRHTYGWPIIGTFDGDQTCIVIGSYCSIARDVTLIAGGNHNSGWTSTFPFRARWGMVGAYEDGQPSSRGNIVIGSDVWIATGATILSGVSIGHGAIIGAGAVVTRSVPPYSVVTGNPAEVRRSRFPPHIVERLIALKWWDWPEETVRLCVPLLSTQLTDEVLAQLEQAARTGGGSLSRQWHEAQV